MAMGFIGEIRMFAGNFAPRNWALCNGQIMSAFEYKELFSLVGTIYGGDGRTNFALPDMRGRVPMQPNPHGEGGLNYYMLGQPIGWERITLSTAEMPTHTHQLQASVGRGTAKSPGPRVIAGTTAGVRMYSTAGADVYMASAAVAEAGGGASHNNIMPYLGVNFIICTFGIYPPRA